MENNIKFIDSAYIPIIKFTALIDKSSIQVDISVEDSRHHGRQVLQFVNSLRETYPQLRPLALTLKKMLYLSKLNNPFTGGLASYGLILMIVACIQVKA